MLHQLLCYGRVSREEHRDRDSEVGQLEGLLDDLPTIGELFLDVEGLRGMAAKDQQVTRGLLGDVMALLEEHNSESATGLRPTGTSVLADQSHDGTEPPKKRLRKDAEHQSPPLARGRNMFDLLVQDGADSDTD
jgi:hypothetical protein